MNAELEDLRRIERETLTLPEERDSKLLGLSYAHEPYYRFFYRFVREFKPAAILELGTDTACSTAHFAAHPETIVTTVDSNAEATQNAKNLGLKNVVAVTADSLTYAKRLGERSDRPGFDVLFIDTLHTFEQAWSEYEAFRPFLLPGSIVLFDDVKLDSEMERLWSKIPGSKVRLDGLHYTGFGASKG